MQPHAVDVTVSALLAWARERGVDRLDAQLLLAHRLGVGRAWLIAHDDKVIDAQRAALFRHDIGQRSAGVPLAYLVGTREFHGLTLQVTPAVLVPRPDTELLVDWALEWLTAWGPSRSAAVLDLGTGSGAIALALCHACPGARVSAVDVSLDALKVARHNADALKLGVEWLHGDWFAPVKGRRFDLIVSNPPYIDADDPHLAALTAEPFQALSPGVDGLAAIDRIIAGAGDYLVEGGALMLEHGYRQGGPVRDLLRRAGFADVVTRRDLAGQERCTGGRWQP